MLIDFVDILNAECFSGIEQGRIPCSAVQVIRTLCVNDILLIVTHGEQRKFMHCGE
jgi:hypothetical protein